jgi:hypothetical protein
MKRDGLRGSRQMFYFTNCSANNFLDINEKLTCGIF